MEKITIVMRQPDHDPVVTQIENSLAILQEIVKGNIETLNLFNDKVALIFNEDGKLLRLPVNKVLLDKRGNPIDVLAGTILIVGIEDNKFVSVPDEMVNRCIETLSDFFIRLN